MSVIGHTITTDKFTYSKDSKMFVAEGSDISRSSVTYLGPLYDDACDQGFLLKSTVTGKVAEFYFTEAIGDEDVVAWIFKPTEKSVRQNPGLRGVTVHILND